MTTERDSLLPARYMVTRTGPRCPLEVGEIVTRGRRELIDIMAGEVVAMEVVQEDGARVMLHKGPETGAYLEGAE